MVTQLHLFAIRKFLSIKLCEIFSFVTVKTKTKVEQIQCYLIITKMKEFNHYVKVILYIQRELMVSYNKVKRHFR